MKFQSFALFYCKHLKTISIIKLYFSSIPTASKRSKISSAMHTALMAFLAVAYKGKPLRDELKYAKEKCASAEK